MQCARYSRLQNIWQTTSEQEVARRHSALKQVLRQAQLPVALVVSRSGAMRSWLTAERSLGVAIGCDVLIADGESYRMPNADSFCFAEQATYAPGDYACLTTASALSAGPIRAAIARSGNKRIGVYHPEKIDVSLQAFLEQHFSDCAIVDVTRPFEQVRMCRSWEEQRLARGATDMLERVFAAIPALLHAGMYESTCVNQIRALLYENGCGDMTRWRAAWVDMTVAPAGSKHPPNLQRYPGRVLQVGDRVDITVHAIGDSWVYGSISRSFLLGASLPEQTQQCWQVAAAASDYAASLLRPGATLQEVADQVNAYLTTAGSAPDPTNFLHGVFYAIQEPPCLYDPSACWPLCSGMIVAVAPAATMDGCLPMRCGDVYVIRDNGAERLGRLEKTLLAIPAEERESRWMM